MTKCASFWTRPNLSVERPDVVGRPVVGAGRLSSGAAQLEVRFGQQQPRHEKCPWKELPATCKSYSRGAYVREVRRGSP